VSENKAVIHDVQGRRERIAAGVVRGPDAAVIAVALLDRLDTRAGNVAAKKATPVLRFLVGRKMGLFW
jgi:hypothetical protein